MRLSTVFAATCAPSMSHALVGHEWSFDNVPSGGLRDVTYPINVANAPQKTGFYFANQFKFIGSGIGYTGLQPRAKANGKTVLHAAFSSFIKGTTSKHSQCSDGADGGSGVSCSVDSSGADYSHTYNMVVENIGGTTWRGTMVDTVTGNKTIVGEYTLPSNAGGIASSQLGFVEYYPWNSQPSHECGDLPKTEVTFNNPTTKTSGATNGVIKKPYEYGDCVGKANFGIKQTSSGWTIDCGF